MKLHGVIELHVKGEALLRAPGFWDKVKKRLGGEPDLRTGKVRAQLEAQAVVDAAQQAFRRLDATNAISLVIDDQVIYQDRDSKADDLGDLLLAFRENASVFGGDFTLLRLAIEHEEVGLHHVIEIVARAEHPADEPAARVLLSARIKDFEPRPGEAAEAYRARVESLTGAPARVETSRQLFDSFVHRVAEALRAAMPEARVELRRAEAVVQKPSTREPARPAQPLPPTDPRYDPHDIYYPNPMYGLVSAMMWGSLFSAAMSPGIIVVDDLGREVGALEDVDPQTGEAADGGDLEGDAGDADAGDFGGGDDLGGDFDGDF
jgi:hypothetical protein